MAIAAVILLVMGLAVSNLSFAQSSSQQSAADQAQQSANQAQSAADQAQQNANQAQGAASNAADQAQGAASGAADQANQGTGGVTGAVTGAAKAVGKGTETGAKKTKDFITGGSKDQDQTGTAAQGQTSGTTSISDTSASAQAHGGKLPQSASPLPLLGLLGLGSVGFGVWRARFRRN
jgi:cobalamin biosynthesis Mg chelatase CobN